MSRVKLLPKVTKSIFTNLKIKIMSKKLFTDEDMRNAFLAGERYENDCVKLNLDEVEEITEPDFGEWMKQEFEINIE